MGKHDKILKAIFETPTKASISWSDIESLFRHLGAAISERRGSKVAVGLNDFRAVFHRPHPRKEASKGLVEDVRRFLLNAGIEP